jgi:hypothetical protein
LIEDRFTAGKQLIENWRMQLLASAKLAEGVVIREALGIFVAMGVECLSV